MIAGVNEILSEDAGVIAAIGMNAAATKVKVYPVVAPSGEELPYLTTSRVANIPTHAKGEVSSLDVVSFAVHVHAESYDDIDNISEAVRVALDQKSSVTETGYQFLEIWYANEYDRPEMFSPERQVYVRTIIFNTQVRRT